MPFFKTAQAPPNDKSSFARWTIRSIDALISYVNTGGREFVVFRTIYRFAEIPTKPQEGTLLYVGPGVLPGNQKGYHYWDGTQWQKL